MGEMCLISGWNSAIFAGQPVVVSGAPGPRSQPFVGAAALAAAAGGALTVGIAARAAARERGPLSARGALTVARRGPAPRMAEREPLSLKVEIPPRGLCGVRFKPLLPESEAVVVKYKVPPELFD